MMSRARWDPARVAAALAISLVVTMHLGGCVESRAFYCPSRAPFATPTWAEDVSVRSADGLTLHGWFVRARDAAPGERRPAVLHCHGNAGNLAGHIAFSGWLADHGFHVLAFDYRGYGRSDAPAGGLTRAHLMDDTHAAWRAMLARPDVDPARCAAYGASLGGAFALALAAQDERVRGVVAAAAFSSWKGIASEKAPGLGWLLVPGGLDPVDSVARLRGRPLLLVHGEEDTIIPPHHSGRLAEAARTAGVRVEVLLLPGVGHNNVLIEGQPPQQRVADWIHRRIAE